jgi:hypothetical protein
MPLEKCVLCGVADHSRDLGLWLVNGVRKVIHLDCWLAAYDAERLRIVARQTT